MNVKLEPCPYCGGDSLELVKVAHPDFYRCWVRCRDCDAYGGDAFGDKQMATVWAVMVWNHRAQVAQRRKVAGMKLNILPCPFCGGDRLELDTYKDEKGRSGCVHCNDCGGMGGHAFGDEEMARAKAIMIWNHRASRDAKASSGQADQPG